MDAAVKEWSDWQQKTGEPPRIYLTKEISYITQFPAFLEWGNKKAHLRELCKVIDGIWMYSYTACVFLILNLFNMCTHTYLMMFGTYPSGGTARTNGGTNYHKHSNDY